MIVFTTNNPNNTDIRAEVGLIHYEPSLLSDEQRAKGIQVDGDIPNINEVPFGKRPILYINQVTKQFFYEFVDRELTPEERIAQLEQQNADMAIALASLLGM